MWRVDRSAFHTKPWQPCSSTACSIRWTSLGATPTWPFTGTVAPNRARWTSRVGCIKASSRISSRGGSNHRGLCRFAFRERNIAAQTVFCSLDNTRIPLAAVPTRTVQRSIGTPFLVSTLWLLPFWNGAIRSPMTNGQISLKMPRSSS